MNGNIISGKSYNLTLAKLDYLFNELEKDLNMDINIRMSREIINSIDCSTIKLDDVLKVLSYEDEEGTKYLDLKTGKLRELNAKELMLSKFENYYKIVECRYTDKEYNKAYIEQLSQLI